MASKFSESLAKQSLSQFVDMAFAAASEKGKDIGIPKEDLHAWMTELIFTPVNYESDAAAGLVQMKTPVVETSVIERPDIFDPALKTTAKVLSQGLKSNPITYQTPNPKNPEEMRDNELPLPYLPDQIDYCGTCQSLAVNGSLYTPCLTRPAKGSKFCKSCETKEHKYGTIEARNSPTNVGGYVDPKGKKAISYGTYLHKRCVDQDLAKNLISERFGAEFLAGIPEHYWVVDKTKAKRVVKAGKCVSTSSDAGSSDGDEPIKKKAGRPKSAEVSADGEKPKKKRGRPKKTETKVEEVVVVSTESWADGLVVETTKPETKKVVTIKVEEVASDEDTKKPSARRQKYNAYCESNSLSAAELKTYDEWKAGEKESKKNKTKTPPSSPKKVTIVEPVVETTKVAVLPEVTVETPKVAVEVAVEQSVPGQYDADESDNDSGDEDEDMSYFTMNGARFGYDEDNTLYSVSVDDFTILGTWDPVTKKPVFDDEDEARSHGWIQ